MLPHFVLSACCTPLAALDNVPYHKDAAKAQLLSHNGGQHQQDVRNLNRCAISDSKSVRPFLSNLAGSLPPTL